ncbi:MAG: hypothetical protein JXR19_09780 [Bacteroidia bacterium]
MDAPIEQTTSNKLIRPTMLTVVCILSFIGSGYGLFDKLTDYLAAPIVETTQDSLEEAREELEDSDAPEGLVNFMESMLGGIQKNMTTENIRKQALWGGLSCIFTLTGAIFMFMLRRKGYYIYLAGIIIYIATPLIAFSGAFAIMGLSVSLVIGAIFLTLYGVNLKHMQA